MVGAKETSFWEARESARAALVAIILVTTLLTQLLINNVQDMLAVIQPVILTVGTLSVACSLIINTSLVTKNKHHHQTAFSAFIALVSVASSLHYYYIAQLNIEHSAFASLHANGDRIVAKRMSQGGLPLHLATSLSMPLIATPAGMHIQWARCVSMINLLIFTLIVVAVYDKIKCNGCIGQERNDQVLSLIYDILVILPSFAGAYFSCLPGASISNDYVELLRAGRSADSMLNHILKNSIAGAACLLELDQKALVEQGCEVCCKNSMLGEALEQLYKSMRWCSLRQVMVDLSAGRYQSTLSTVDVGAFLAGLCKGGVLFACEDATASVCQDTHSIAFDEKIAILAMENGVSNALSHGDQAAIKLKAEFFQSSDGCGKICFSVENRLPPDRRLLTSQDLKNCRDHALCEIATRKLDFAGASQKVMGGKSNCEQNADSGTVQMTTSSRGNRSGLRHTGRACIGAGGSFDLFLREEHGKDPSVVFQIILPAQLIKKTALNMHSTKPLPSIFSPVSTINGEVDNIPEGLRICAIDDSKLICKGYKRLLLPKCKASKDSCVETPIKKSAVDDFINSVIGCEESSNRPADIVILDQHIEVNTGESLVLGTDIAHDLRARHYEGLVLIRSANSSTCDCEVYMSSGEVDGCLGKAQSHIELIRGIAKAYWEKQGKTTGV